MTVTQETAPQGGGCPVAGVFPFSGSSYRGPAPVCSSLRATR
ncbi:hypothetical protein [Streptomyces sp. NPDC056600]